MMILKCGLATGAPIRSRISSARCSPMLSLRTLRTKLGPTARAWRWSLTSSTNSVMTP